MWFSSKNYYLNKCLFLKLDVTYDITDIQSMYTIRKRPLFFTIPKLYINFIWLSTWRKSVGIFHYKHLILSKYEGWEIFKIYEENAVIVARL